MKSLRKDLESRIASRNPSSQPYHKVEYNIGASLDFVAGQHLVAENTFRQAPMDTAALPDFASSRGLLPDPFWEGYDDAIAAYWHAWELAFSNLRKAATRLHAANYIDTAFNGGLFAWDSVFILQFCRYGLRAFPFQRTLDNFYTGQRDDGFMCRELRADGSAQFHKHDPASTGPNLFAWSEWAHYQNSGDEDRLACVFPVILAYHRWLRLNRSWPSGTYYSCGLACGMDNMKRVGAHYEPHVHHGHLTWIDATAQAALSAERLLKMADVLGRSAEVAAERDEYEWLRTWVDHAWDDDLGFAFDVDRHNRPTGIKHIGCFWVMMARLLSPDRARRMAAHLNDPASFKRHHRVPTLAADQPGYAPQGAYWNGAIWAPTNWMVLKALNAYNLDDLAHEVACNHYDTVLRIWKDTGTFWENYAPEADQPGSPAKRDFVGWSGLPPIAVFLEHRLGLRPDVPRQTLVWDIRETAKHGCKRYPFGQHGLLDLECAARGSSTEAPIVSVSSNTTLTIRLLWNGQSRTVEVKGHTHVKDLMATGDTNQGQ